MYSIYFENFGEGVFWESRDYCFPHVANALWKTRFEFGKNFGEKFRNPGICVAAIILQSDNLHTSGLLAYEHLFAFIWLLDSGNFAILHNLTFVKC